MLTFKKNLGWMYWAGLAVSTLLAAYVIASLVSDYAGRSFSSRGNDVGDLALVLIAMLAIAANFIIARKWLEK